MWSRFGQLYLAVEELDGACALYRRLLGVPELDAVDQDAGSGSLAARDRREAPAGWARLSSFALDNAQVTLCAPARRFPGEPSEGPHTKPTIAPEGERQRDRSADGASVAAHSVDPWQGLLAERLAEGGAGMFGFSLIPDSLEKAVETLSQRGLDWQPAGASPPPRGLALAPDQAGGIRIRVAAPDSLAGSRVAGAPRAPSDASGAWAASAAAAGAADPVVAEARVLGIDHVVIRTRAPERAIRFYRDQLGVRLALDRAFPERGVRLIFFRLAGVTIEIAASLAQPEAPDEAATDTLWGVAYRVAHPHATHDRLTREGFDPSPVRAGNKPGTEVFTVRDQPLGIPTLVIGPVAVGPGGSDGGSGSIEPDPQRER